MPLEPVVEGDPHVPAHNEERDAINDLQLDVVTRISNPTIKNLGSMLRWDGDNWVASKMRIFEGTGSPEGSVSAPVGSRYVDAAAIGGIAEYLKATGTGNTGWVPLNVSLPWSTITPGPGYAHVSGIPAQACMINNIVYLRGALQRNSGTGLFIGTLPAGMGPSEYVNCHLRIGNAVTPVLVQVQPDGDIHIGSGGMINATPLYMASITGAPFRRA